MPNNSLNIYIYLFFLLINSSCLGIFLCCFFALHVDIIQQRALPEEIIVHELEVTAKLKEMHQ